MPRNPWNLTGWISSPAATAALTRSTLLRGAMAGGLALAGRQACWPRAADRLRQRRSTGASGAPQARREAARGDGRRRRDRDARSECGRVEHRLGTRVEPLSTVSCTCCRTRRSRWTSPSRWSRTRTRPSGRSSARGRRLARRLAIRPRRRHVHAQSHGRSQERAVRRQRRRDDRPQGDEEGRQAHAGTAAAGRRARVPAALPAAADADRQERRDGLQDPIGTGPFKYVSFTPGQSSLFHKNEHYWEAGGHTSTSSRCSRSPMRRHDSTHSSPARWTRSTPCPIRRPKRR